MQLSYRSQFVRHMSGIMAATSFGAIAEMAGGADRKDHSIIVATASFAICMVIAGYIYVTVYEDSYYAEIGELEKEWCDDWFAVIVWDLCCGVYFLGVMSLLGYFSGYAVVLCFVAVVLIASLVRGRRRVVPDRRQARPPR